MAVKPTKVDFVLNIRWKTAVSSTIYHESPVLLQDPEICFSIQTDKLEFVTNIHKASYILTIKTDLYIFPEKQCIIAYQTLSLRENEFYRNSGKHYFL